MVTAYFLDSSALVKRYVIETGTAWVRGLTRHKRATVVYIAQITAVEVACAVARRRKGKTLTPRHASSILRRFRQHLAGRYTVIEVTPDLLDEAVRLGNTCWGGSSRLLGASERAITTLALPSSTDVRANEIPSVKPRGERLRWGFSCRYFHRESGQDPRQHTIHNSPGCKKMVAEGSGIRLAGEAEEKP